METLDIEEKFTLHVKQTNFTKLDSTTQEFFRQIYKTYPFSFQELKQLIDFSIDFTMWQEKSIEELFQGNYKNKKEAFYDIKQKWEELKNKPHSYQNFSFSQTTKQPQKTYEFQGKKLALGSCPVASESTRCCNLLTLDAVNSCGFDCSYCSIQSFYKEGNIGFDKNFAKNLKELQLDKNKTYHIGTGQSSDSLMWGNKNGVLKALLEFAKENPNVILEFKTKSNNIKYLLEHEVPKNIICTWSLNTPTIIKNEEHLTASLEERLEAAKKLSQKGVLVGFHFHPIVKYENYLQEYKEVYKTLLATFSPNQVALISLGTLTFIKPVIKKIRSRNFTSKILQMPLINASGKLSYPLHVKKEMFSHAYQSFKAWHKKVYFYMCMEDKSLWSEVFGFEYENNDAMEKEMKQSYFEKIKLLNL